MAQDNTVRGPGGQVLNTSSSQEFEEKTNVVLMRRSVSKFKYESVTKQNNILQDATAVTFVLNIQRGVC